MSYVIIFPSDYFKPNKPDETFNEQAQVFTAAGFECKYINLENLPTMTKLPYDLSGKGVIYRGWMLDAENYDRLCYIVENSNGRMFTPLDKYLLAHHLPNWYPLIKDYTAETVVLDPARDFKEQLINLGWNGYFIKDYVKSLKTSIGSVITNADQIDAVVKEMEKFRGTIEGGICVRRVENYLPDTEQRFFIINGRPYSPVDQPIREIVLSCSEYIDHQFYSLDLIKTKDGKDMVVEIGDGQVSDYVGWDLNRFVNMLSISINK